MKTGFSKIMENRETTAEIIGVFVSPLAKNILWNIFEDMKAGRARVEIFMQPVTASDDALVNAPLSNRIGIKMYDSLYIYMAHGRPKNKVIKSAFS
ncbi:hypothetical protein FACS1894152_0840 [Bacilli bacterium]|nr:hypothetical protein FACS1894152_0840 [Bacilli bacterium]